MSRCVIYKIQSSYSSKLVYTEEIILEASSKSPVIPEVKK